jgi:Peptidase family C25
MVVLPFEMPPPLPDGFKLSAQVLRIEIGDDVLDTFEEDGLYALTFDQVRRLFPQAVGLPVKTLRLFTGPADTLDQQATAPQLATGGPYRPPAHRWREVPLQVRDDGDSTFDAGDTLVFWGQGTSRWRATSDWTTGNSVAPTSDPAAYPESYRFVTNPFSLRRAYFLDLGGKATSAPARMQVWPEGSTQGSALSSPTLRSQGFNYLRAQIDRVSNFCDPSGKLDTEAGLTWYWHWRGDCKTAPPTVELSSADLARPHLRDLQGLVAESLYVTFDFPRAAHHSYSEVHFMARYQGQTMASPEAAPYFYVEDKMTVRRTLGIASPGAPEISLSWSGSLKGMGMAGYDIRYLARYRNLRAPYMIFPGGDHQRPDSGAGESAWQMLDLAPNSIGYSVLAVDGIGLAWRPLPPSGILPAPAASTASLIHVVPALRSLHENQLAVFDPSPDPEPGIDYLLIAPQALMAGAEKLAVYRETVAGGSHKTGTLSIESIFARFAGGRPEPAALRDYLQHAHATWGAQTLRHVLLLGDGHYDVRNVTRKVSEKNPNGISPFIVYDQRGFSQTSDERFTFFGDTLGFSLGRLPLASLAEIDGYVAKAKAYDDPKQGGAWRGRLLWVADDAFQHGAGQNGGLETSYKHTNDVEGVYHSVKSLSPRWHHSKVLLVNYPANSVNRKPEAAQDLVDQWNRGALTITYFGHGAYNQWADEGLAYTPETLPRLRNAGRLPMVNSFSCTVGRFENGQGDVFTEQLVRKPEGGAIAGLAATRETYVSTNTTIAPLFYAQLLRQDSLGGPLPAGEALRRAKNQYGARFVSDASSYVLLGEPVLRVAWPGLDVALDPGLDTLRALECGTVSGHIEGGGVGHVQVTVNAGVTPRTWEYPYEPVGDGTFAKVHVLQAELPGKVLFAGGASFSGGRFKLDYVMPLQIPFGDSMATLLVQAFDTTAARMGAAIHYPIRLEGVAAPLAPAAPAIAAPGQGAPKTCLVQDDKRGPRITLTGCDEREMAVADLPPQFHITLPYCLRLRITDSSGGVHASEAPDEGTVVSIPGSIDPYHPLPGIDEPMRKEYRIGLAKSQLRLGEHELRVSAADAYGNRTFRSYRLGIVQDTLRSMLTAFNVPNPMKRSGTTFHFAASVPADDGEYAINPKLQRMTYNLRIYDQLGRMVAAFDSLPEPTFRWEGRTAFGTRLANGIYPYSASAVFNPGDGSPARHLRSQRKVLVISR